MDETEAGLVVPAVVRTNTSAGRELLLLDVWQMCPVFILTTWKLQAGVNCFVYSMYYVLHVAHCI